MSAGRRVTQKKRCVICGAPFEAMRADHQTCSAECSRQNKNAKRRARKAEAQKRKSSLTTRTCTICGATFQPRSKDNHICSKRCRIRAKNNSRVVHQKEKVCPECGKTFRPSCKATQVCCSHECALNRRYGREREAKKKMETRICEYCGDEFLTRRCGTARFCGYSCSNYAYQEAQLLEAAKLRAESGQCPFAGEWQDEQSRKWPAMQTYIPGVAWADACMDPMSGGFPMVTFSVPSAAQEVAA